MTEFQEFVAGLGTLTGNKVTGAAYSERNDEPTVIINLIDEKGTLTSFYVPLD